MTNLSAPFGRFVGRLSAAIHTADRRPGSESFPAADTASSSIIIVPSEGGTGSPEAPTAATAVPQGASCPSSTSRGADSAVTTDPAASSPSAPHDPASPTALPPSGPISNGTRRRTAAAAGTDLPSGPAGPLVRRRRVLRPRRTSQGRDRLWPSLRPLLLIARLPLLQ